MKKRITNICPKHNAINSLIHFSSRANASLATSKMRLIISQGPSDVNVT